MTSGPTWVFPGLNPGWYLLSLLDSVQVDLQYVALQPTNEQGAAVSQQETVHILTLIQPVREGPRGWALQLPILSSYSLPSPSRAERSLTNSQI